MEEFSTDIEDRPSLEDQSFRRSFDSKAINSMKSAVDEVEGEKYISPDHYSKMEDSYEHQKVVVAWGLDYHTGCATKYISRAGNKIEKGKTRKEMIIKDYNKAIRYLQMKIELIEDGSIEV
jgi:hypothetical protein